MDASGNEQAPTSTASEVSAADLAAWARAAIRSKGVRAAASELGIPRPVLLSVAAEAPLRTGSLALARQRFAERAAASSPGDAA